MREKEKRRRIYENKQSRCGAPLFHMELKLLWSLLPKEREQSTFSQKKI
jgi:hypothetical protein